MVFDRRRRELVEECVLGDALLRLAYRRPVRAFSEIALFSNALVSRLLGWYCDTSWSRRKIRPALTSLGIDTDEFREPVERFETFNRVFTRHLRADARPHDPAPGVLCSPADARLTVMPRLDGTVCVPVKGASFSLEKLLQAAPEDVAEFANGPLLILRLCPADYHRFHYPAAGRELRRCHVAGKLHSVNPIALALGLDVFAGNRRVVSMLEFERFGKAVFIEVGAFGVAGIVQTHQGPDFEKMAEKGYFRFGASTIILVFQPGRVVIDDDLLQHSRTGVETLVRAGETIGRSGQ